MILDQHWLQQRGGLNDAKIVLIEQTSETAMLVIEDEWANFAGLPEYRGPSEIKIVSNGGRIRGETPSNLAMEFVDEVTLEQTDSTVSLTITWYGQASLTVLGSPGKVLVL